MQLEALPDGLMDGMPVPSLQVMRIKDRPVFVVATKLLNVLHKLRKVSEWVHGEDALETPPDELLLEMFGSGLMPPCLRKALHSVRYLSLVSAPG